MSADIIFRFDSVPTHRTISLIRPTDGSPSDTAGAPPTPLEATIIGIWTELLENRRLSVCDDLFQSGVNSLLVVRFILKIKEKFLRDLELREVFENPTARQQASLLLRMITEDR